MFCTWAYRSLPAAAGHTGLLGNEVGQPNRSEVKCLPLAGSGLMVNVECQPYDSSSAWR